MMETQATISLERLPEALVSMIRVAAGVAQAHRCPLYLVGGFVRDFLLGRESLDLDFAVGAEPLSFASEVAEKFGARFVPLHIDPPTGRIVRWDDEYPDATADFTEFRGRLERGRFASRFHMQRSVR
jgi:tRNA nucleotidyltransferase (CCA-adding enzyme)